MPRKFRHISDYEEEIIKMYEDGMNLRTIGEKLGFTYKEMRDFKTRYNKKQRIAEFRKAMHKKDGEVPPSTQRLDKLAQMRYVMASKDRYIKQLEMENELLWGGFGSQKGSENVNQISSNLKTQG